MSDQFCWVINYFANLCIIKCLMYCLFSVYRLTMKELLLAIKRSFVDRLSALYHM